MYNEIIDIVRTEMKTQLIDKLTEECSMSVGFFIHKEELLKALSYDRNQYQSGYVDGKDEVLYHTRWNKCEDTLPELWQNVYVIGVSCDGKKTHYIARREPNPDNRTWDWIENFTGQKITVYDDFDIVYWHPMLADPEGDDKL